MTEDELARAIQQLRAEHTDDANYEAKECAHELSKDIWESVSAFANTNGGVLLLGLSERHNFTPVPGFELEKVCEQFLSGMGDSELDDAKLVNIPQYSVQRLIFEDSMLLVITIKELDAAYKPCYKKELGISEGSYKRVGDADILLSPDEIHAF